MVAVAMELQQLHPLHSFQLVVCCCLALDVPTTFSLLNLLWPCSSVITAEEETEEITSRVILSENFSHSSCPHL